LNPQRFYFCRTCPHARRFFQPNAVPLNMLGFEIRNFAVIALGQFVLKHLSKLN
jgi:hypothetical protein